MSAQRKNDSSGHKYIKRKNPSVPIKDDGSGVKSQSHVPLGPRSGSTTGETVEYIQDIWHTLGVGHNGYLVFKELEKVCHHIGMDKMDQKDLQNLFRKLDLNGDGRVSFQEFVEGLFQPPKTDSKKKSASHYPQKPKRRSFPNSSRSRDALNAGSPMFHYFTIDPEHTGFAKPEDVVELWEKMNIPKASEVLQALGFRLDERINLAELSLALEQELGVDDYDSVYQAAMVSMKQELRTLRLEIEHLTEERNRLSLDLQEARARNSVLVSQMDDRYASMEKSTETRLLTIEKQYQDQVSNLQMALEEERKTHSAAATTLRQSVQNQMENIKQDETLMKEQLQQAKLEVEHLEHNLIERNEQLSEAQKKNAWLQSRLDDAELARKQITAQESSGRRLSAKQEWYMQDHIERLEAENKRLKNNNDELMKQRQKQKLCDECQSSRGLNTSGSPSLRSSSLPVLSGLLSSNEELEKWQSNVLIQELLERERKEQEYAYHVEVAELEEKYSAEKEGILNNLEKEKAKLLAECERSTEERLALLTQELTKAFALEKQDLIQKHESEKNLLKIRLKSELQENYAKRLLEMQKQLEKESVVKSQPTCSESKTRNLAGDMLEICRKEKEELRKSYELKLADFEVSLSKERTLIAELRMQIADLKYKLQVQENKLWHEFEMEKRRLKEHFEAEKLSLQDNAEQVQGRLQADVARCQAVLLAQQDKNALLRMEKDSMKKELELEFQQETEKLLHKFAEEKDKTDRDRKKRDAIVLELKRANEDMQLQWKLQEDELRQQWINEQQLANLSLLQTEENHRQQVMALENMLTGGLDCLQGKLREDFFLLLQQEKDKELDQDRVTLQLALQQRESDLEAMLQKVLQDKESEWSDRLQQQLTSLTSSFEDDRLSLMQKYKSEIEDLNMQIRDLRRQLEEEQKTITESLEKECSIRQTLETDYKQELYRLNAELEEQKILFEKWKKQSEAHLDELQEALDAATNEKELVSGENNELTSINEQLTADMHTLNQVQEELEAVREELMSVREELQSAQQYNRRNSRIEENDEIYKDTKIAVAVGSSTSHFPQSQLDDYRGFLQDKEELEKKINSLQQQVQKFSDDRNVLLNALQKLSNDKEELEHRLQTASLKLQKSTAALDASQSGQDFGPNADLQSFTHLQLELLEQQRNVSTLQERLHQCEVDSKQLLRDMESDWQTKLVKSEAEKLELIRKLDEQLTLLKNQAEKLSLAHEVSIRRNQTLKDLYVENAELLKSLQSSEEQYEAVHHEAVHHEKQCQVLKQALQKLYKAGLAGWPDPYLETSAFF